jgi:hypothetical protein
VSSPVDGGGSDEFVGHGEREEGEELAETKRSEEWCLGGGPL